LRAVTNSRGSGILSSTPDARTGSVDAGRRIVAAGTRAGHRTGIGIGLIIVLSLLHAWLQGLLL
jgi:hypothetical protein